MTDLNALDAIHVDLTGKGYRLTGMYREYCGPTGMTIRVPMHDPDAARLKSLEPTDQLSLPHFVRRNCIPLHNQLQTEPTNQTLPCPHWTASIVSNL